MLERMFGRGAGEFMPLMNIEEAVSMWEEFVPPFEEESCVLLLLLLLLFYYYCYCN